MTNGKYLKPYTWIYRWEDPNKFRYIVDNDPEPFKQALFFRPDEKKKYLQNIKNTTPHIVNTP